jgi:hypothetical protein
LAKLHKHNPDELGAHVWLTKLTVNELRALGYEYYKTVVPKTIKAKVVTELVHLYTAHPERLSAPVDSIV